MGQESPTTPINDVCREPPKKSLPWVDGEKGKGGDECAKITKGRDTVFFCRNLDCNSDYKIVLSLKIGAQTCEWCPYAQENIPKEMTGCKNKGKEEGGIMRGVKWDS